MKDAIYKKGSELGSRSYGSFTGRAKIRPEEKTQAIRICRQLQSSLRFAETHSEYYEHGYRSGVLHESNLWQIAANVENARPFSLREVVSVPDVHIGLLVDCSGSMNACCPSLNEAFGFARNSYSRYDGPTTMTAARILSLGLAMALDEQEGVHLAIAGHTEVAGEVCLMSIKRLNTRMDENAFSALNASAGNLDGIALAAFAREMSKQMGQGEPALIFLICDGAPCHSPMLMKQSIDLCKHQYNATVLPIGVGDDLDDDTCTRLYGAGNYVLARDVLSSASVIASRTNQLVEELKPM